MKLTQLAALVEGKDPAVLSKALDDVAEKLKAVETALAEAKAAGAKLPGLFKQHIHAGAVHNLDTPKEYALWVSLENLKDMYSASKGLRETKESLMHAKSQLKAFK